MGVKRLSFLQFVPVVCAAMNLEQVCSRFADKSKDSIITSVVNFRASMKRIIDAADAGEEVDKEKLAQANKWYGRYPEWALDLQSGTGGGGSKAQKAAEAEAYFLKLKEENAKIVAWNRQCLEEDEAEAAAKALADATA